MSTQIQLVDTRRLKSGRTQTNREQTSDARQLGDEPPPLFDGKPAFWQRWVYFLLALDMLFTGFSVDMVMRKWTHLVPVTPPSDSSYGDSSSSEPSEKYELRPLWHRLALSSFEVFVGAAAGALILASRDRTVWRLRVRRVPMSTLPPGRVVNKLPPVPSSGVQMINLLVLETGSGRTKRFLMRDCKLMSGRDLSELFLSIDGIRGRFVVSMNGARVLGVTTDDVGDSKVLKELAVSKEIETDVTRINSTAGGADLENVHLAELRKALAKAWIRADGTLTVEKPSSQAHGWTSGPVMQSTR